MQAADVIQAISVVGTNLLGVPVIAGRLRRADACCASLWPAHPTGYGHWDWLGLICKRRSNNDWLLHISLLNGSTGKPFSVVWLSYQPISGVLQLKLLASDPASPRVWNGFVMPILFLALDTANLDGHARALWINAPASGLVARYIRVAAAAGFVLISQPCIAENKLKFMFS